jgi:hypothetical protein
MRTNGAGLLFKQAVGSAHRAVVDIKVHFEMAARGSSLDRMFGLAATDKSFYTHGQRLESSLRVSAIGNRLRKALGAALNAECAADRKDGAINHLGEALTMTF